MEEQLLLQLKKELKETQEYKRALMSEHEDELAYAFDGHEVEYLIREYNKQMRLVDQEIDGLLDRIIYVESKIILKEGK